MALADSGLVTTASKVSITNRTIGLIQIENIDENDVGKEADDEAQNAEPKFNPSADQNGTPRHPKPSSSELQFRAGSQHSLTAESPISICSTIDFQGTDNALPGLPFSVFNSSMAPPTRARSLPKNQFPSLFSKLKTSTYTDTTRPSALHNIRTLSWNAPGTLIATGAADKTLRIWNPERTNAKNSTELRGHGGSVERVAFHPINETELASCGTDGYVRFWDVRSKASVGEVKLHTGALYLTWKPDGKDIVVGTKDETLIPIDRAMLRPISEHRQRERTNQSVFNWSGTQLYVTDHLGHLRILRYPSFEPLLELNAHTSACQSVAISPSGTYVGVGGADALISLWDTQELICMRTLDECTGPVLSVDFSFDGSYVVGGSEEGNRLHIAHTETGEYVYHIDTTYPALQVAWHPCRYVLAYSAEAQGLKIVGGIGGL